MGVRGFNWGGRIGGLYGPILNVGNGNIDVHFIILMYMSVLHMSSKSVIDFATNGKKKKETMKCHTAGKESGRLICADLGKSPRHTDK